MKPFKLKLIYPKWHKLKGQTTFNLPPHGPVAFAATLPEWVEVSFTDENVEPIDFEEECDGVALSMMLSTQVKRGWEIAEEYHKRGKLVMAGGISTMLHAEDTVNHVDCVFLGESEGRMEEVMQDWVNGKLRKFYNYMGNMPPIESVGPCRRDLYKRELYNHKGVQMVDLFHASRGCRFSCYPCAVSYLGGRKFRPRPIDKVVEDMAAIDNNRLFIVDNSLAQNKEWEKELFTAIAPLKKKWISHTIEDDPEVLDLAAKAGAWYVYQAVYDTSDYIKERVKRYHDYGIGVEGTILLGLDNQTEDDIKRLIDFLGEIDLDLTCPHTWPTANRFAGRVAAELAIANDAAQQAVVGRRYTAILVQLYGGEGRDVKAILCVVIDLWRQAWIEGVNSFDDEHILFVEAQLMAASLAMPRLEVEAWQFDRFARQQRTQLLVEEVDIECLKTFEIILALSVARRLLAVHEVVVHRDRAGS